jgi:hypothetical protein
LEQFLYEDFNKKTFDNQQKQRRDRQYIIKFLKENIKKLEEDIFCLKEIIFYSIRN